MEVGFVHRTLVKDGAEDDLIKIPGTNCKMRVVERSI